MLMLALSMPAMARRSIYIATERRDIAKSHINSRCVSLAEQLKIGTASCHAAILISNYNHARIQADCRSTDRQVVLA